MKIIYRAGNITEAHIVAGMLESHGIESHVGGHYLQGGVGEMAPMDFSSVQVADEDYENALPLIAGYEESKPVYDAEDEPSETTSGLFTKPVLFWIAVILLAYWLLF